MNNSPYIVDVTQADFAQVVLENSYRVPVLVDFWATWCQPCQMLTPLLNRLAESARGAFLLAKVNADQEQALARQFGVRALPTVKVFRNGQVVEDLTGVQPESVYWQVIERHRAKPSDRLLDQVEAAWQRGKRKQALELLRQAQAREPDNVEIKLSLAEKLLLSGETAEASALLNGLPPEVRMDEPASALLAHLEFIEMAKDAPSTAALEKAVRANPADCAKRRQLGARQLLEGNFEDALEQFMEILRRDRKFGDDAGRKGLLAVFKILGSDHPLVAAYRRRMSALLL